MTKDYFVLRKGKVVYKPGHHDIDGAMGTAMVELRVHPKSEVTIVRVIDRYVLTGPEGAER